MSLERGGYIPPEVKKEEDEKKGIMSSLAKKARKIVAIGGLMGAFSGEARANTHVEVAGKQLEIDEDGLVVSGDEGLSMPQIPGETRIVEVAPAELRVKQAVNKPDNKDVGAEDAYRELSTNLPGDTKKSIFFENFLKQTESEMIQKFGNDKKIVDKIRKEIDQVRAAGSAVSDEESRTELVKRLREANGLS